MRKRLMRLLTVLAAILAAGVLYFFLIALTGFTVPCVFHLITGLYCPGCGMTRMCVDLAKFDFYGAFRSNPAAFAIMPMLAAVFCVRGATFVKYGKAVQKKWMSVMEIISCIILIIFGILRNIPAFSFLAPYQ